MKQWVVKLWRGWIVPLIAAVLVVGSFRTAVADWNDVPSMSMKPTILEGERIVVNKLAYDLKFPFTRLRLARFSEPRRGDIAILFSPADGKRLVKRVVAVPGDVIAMRDERLILNGQAVSYAAADEAAGWRRTLEPGQLLAVERLGDRTHPIAITPSERAIRSFGPVKVPDGFVFVMGDNRDRSHDSRYFGLVPIDAITGRAFAVAVSLDPHRSFLPRWERFFRALS